MVLLNGLRMIVIIRYYNYNSNSRYSKLVLNAFLRRVVQIIGSEIIQINVKVFSKIEGTFSELHLGYPHENISNFKKYILRLSEAY